MMPVEHLRLEDFSDREFMLVMADLAEEDGWCDSERIRAQLDLAERRIASTRLSWLARYGAVEREHERDEHGQLRYYKDGRPRHTQRWRMTEVGEALAYGQLRKRESTALEGAADSGMLQLMRMITERTRTADATTAKLMVREWRYGTSPLRNGRV